MFGQWFKRHKYEQILTKESKKSIPKETMDSCCSFCFKAKKTNMDLSFKTYQLDATMYKGRYLLTYEQWVERMKNDK